MPTFADAWWWRVGCVLALESVRAVYLVIVLYSPAAKPPFLRKPPRPPPKGEPDRRPGRGGPAPADEAPGRTTAPGRSAGRANRRAAQTAQGTTEEGPPAQRSEAGGPGRSRRRTQQNDLVLLGWCPSNPTRTFVLLGIEAVLPGPLQTSRKTLRGKVRAICLDTCTLNYSTLYVRSINYSAIFFQFPEKIY